MRCTGLGMCCKQLQRLWACADLPRTLQHTICAAIPNAGAAAGLCGAPAHVLLRLPAQRPTDQPLHQGHRHAWLRFGVPADCSLAKAWPASIPTTTPPTQPAPAHPACTHPACTHPCMQSRLMLRCSPASAPSSTALLGRRTRSATRLTGGLSQRPLRGAAATRLRLLQRRWMCR